MVKEDFIIGKWYALNPYNNLQRLWYIKFLSINSNNVIRASEYISNDKNYYCSQGNFGINPLEFWDINISEIAKYLPKNHPDLEQNILQSLEIW